MTAPASEAGGGVLNGLLQLYVFIVLIPLSELLSRYVGTNFKLPIIMGAIVSVGVLFSGQAMRFWSLRVAKFWMLLLALFVIASFAGQYRGLSVPLITNYGLRFHIFPFLICAAAQTGTQVRRLLYAGAAGGVFVLIVCAFYGSVEEGRFTVLQGSSLENPNDLALLLLTGAIFTLSLRFSSSRILRLIPLVTLPVSVYFILRTASRANFLTIVLLLAITLLLAEKRVKLIMIAAAPLLAAGMLLVLPSSTWNRLTMIALDPTVGENSALDSQIARTELQKNGLELTLRHPLLGVGPLMFANAVDVMVREDTGHKSGWQGTHNVYLQMAAENGIPAGLLFIGIAFWMNLTNYRVFKLCTANEAIHAYRGQSFCLLLLTLGFSFGLLFGNYAYETTFPILVGLTAANYLAMQSASGSNNPRHA